MKVIERQFPLLSWIMKARQARFFAKGFFAALSQTGKNRLIARELNLQVATDAENQPDIAALQFQLGMTKNVQFLPLNKDVDNVPLAENEVLFVPVSLIANRYITFYNSGYLLQDIENFVDPKRVCRIRDRLNQHLAGAAAKCIVQTILI